MYGNASLKEIQHYLVFDIPRINLMQYLIITMIAFTIASSVFLTKCIFVYLLHI